MKTLLSRWIGVMGLVFFTLPGCSKKNGLPPTPPSNGNIGSSGRVKSYDDGAGPSRTLKLQYFNTSSGNHTITLVSEDGSIPGTEPLEFRNRGAITAGQTAWKITITQDGNAWVDGVFGYDFASDPDLKDDPERPACWGSFPGEGQDWSGYTNFACDVWGDPEDPVWAEGGWWLEQFLIFEQASGNPWTNEQAMYYPPDSDFSLPDLVLDRRTCNWAWNGFTDCNQYRNYYQVNNAVDGTDFRPGLNRAVWKFQPDLDRQSTLSEGRTTQRWTNWASVKHFWFVMGGAVTGMKVGSSFFIDNPRVVRAEKPDWEDNLDASAFAEYFPWTPGKNSETATTWTSTGSGAQTFVREVAWTNAQKWDNPAVVVNLANGEGAAVTVNKGTGSAACAPGDQGPVTLYVKYRTNDANMALLLDYSVDGTYNGIISNGPVTLNPGNTDWQRLRLRVDEADPWSLAEVEGAKIFLKAVDLGGSVSPSVDVDMVLLAGRPCGYYCYHPYNANWALGWPDWRK